MKLQGYRTYLCAGLIAVATVVHYLGYIDDNLFKSILVFLGAGGLAALRAGISEK